jgi:hypothetical protein
MHLQSLFSSDCETPEFVGKAVVSLATGNFHTTLVFCVHATVYKTSNVS